MSASKIGTLIKKAPNDLVGAVILMRKAFINLPIKNIPAKNFFLLYAVWLAAIITIHKANGI